MARYERQDAHGHRFVATQQVGDVSVIRRGKLGSYGRSTVESHRDEAAARARVAECEAQLEREGYVAISEQRSASQPFDPELKRALEQALREDPRARDAWAVYADLLTGFMPQLGQRIVLELAREQAPSGQTEALTARIRELDRRHRRRWAGRGLGQLLSRRGKPPPGLELDWRYGFILGARLRWSELTKSTKGLVHVYEQLVASPAARLLSRLSVVFDQRFRWRHGQDEGILARLASGEDELSLRSLDLSSYSVDPLDISAFLGAHPKLERVRLAGILSVGAKLEHGQLRELCSSGRESDASLASRLPRLTLPALESLDFELVRNVDGGRRWAMALFNGALLESTKLRRVRVSQHERAEPWLRVIMAAPMFEQLRELELDLLVDDASANLMLDNVAEFARFERLHLADAMSLSARLNMQDALPQVEFSRFRPP